MYLCLCAVCMHTSKAEKAYQKCVCGGGGDSLSLCVRNGNDFCRGGGGVRGHVQSTGS